MTPIIPHRNAAFSARTALPPLTSTDIAEVLSAIPARTPYESHTWIRATYAVLQILGETAALPILSNWSPATKPHENTEKMYRAKFRSAFTFRDPSATLVGIAKNYGFDARAFALRRSR